MRRRALLTHTLALAAGLLAGCSGSVSLKASSQGTAGPRLSRLLLVTDLRDGLGGDLGAAIEASLRELLVARGTDPVMGQWPERLTLERTEDFILTQATNAGRESALVVQTARVRRGGVMPGGEEVLDIRLLKAPAGAVLWRAELSFRASLVPFSEKADGRRIAEEIVAALGRDKLL